jgi:D-arabinose 1-dehydrogenase-like Zn-dependent alcohol dehydrogenase
MKSYDVVDWGRPLQMRVRETPVPRGREVLMRLTHCGVCHSDLHVRDGYFDMGGGKKLAFADRGIRPPVTLGHEALGVVAAVGPAVTEVRPGESYLVNPWIGCGSCAMCMADKDNLCHSMRTLGIVAPGGFATHMLVPDPKYLVDVGGLEPARAAPLACSGVTTYSAAKKLQPIDPADWIAVIGCGGVGLMAQSVLRGLGHERIIACDIDDAKLAAARTRGATHTCNLKTEGPDRLTQIAGGPLYGILDFVGAPATVSIAPVVLRKGGRLVLCGLIGGEVSLSLPLFGLREIAILGSFVGSTRDLVELVRLVKDGKVCLADVERRSLDQAEQSLRDLADGKVVGRIVLEIKGES